MRSATLFFLLCASVLAGAQAKRPLPFKPATTPPAIDGDLSDPVWKGASQATGFTDFSSGSVQADQTIVSVAADDKYIYIAFDCRDAHPEAIVARETSRDSKFQNSNQGNRNTEDNVEVDFDAFLSHGDNDLTGFSVNPLGTRSAFFAGGRGAKAEWNGEWVAAAKKGPTGWTAEMQIPWASLNYPTGRPKINIGINFKRYIDRTKTLQEWSTTGPQGFLENEGVWTDVSVPQVTAKPRLSLLPYAIGGQTRDGLGARFGLDARYPITPQLTAVGTIKPDYSNIENAITSIQFSHQERFVPDRRPFFVEGGDDFYAQTNINDIGAFFYSNRIPKFDVGTKFYGKLTPKDTVGLLDTYGFEGRNDLAFRYLHNYNATSSGGMMLVRKDDGGDQNTVAVLDQHLRTGKAGFEVVGAQATGTAAGGGTQVVSSYYQDKVWTHLLQYSAISNTFNAADGFIPFVGYKGITNVEALGYNWQHGYLRSAEAVIVPLYWMYMDGRPYFRGIQSNFDVTTRSDWFVNVGYNDFWFADERDKTIDLQVTKGLTNRFQQVGVKVSTGETGSKRSTFVGPSFKWRVIGKLDLLYSGGIQNRDGVSQQHVMTGSYELSPTRSFGGRVITTGADTNVYFFYRNSGGKGTEYYVLFGDPNQPKTVHSLQIKAVFAL